MNSNLQRERFCNVLSNILSDELSRISLFSSSAINHQRIERITQEQTLQNTKKKRGLQSSLFSCPKTHLKYFYYIMNFSKVNVRDLAEAKYEDTYLLTTFKLYHVFQITNSLWFFIRTCQNYCIKNTYRIKKGASIPMERIVINNEKFL